MKKEQIIQLRSKLDDLEKNLNNELELDWTDFENGLKKLFAEMNSEELEDMREEINQMRDRVAKLQSIISLRLESLRKDIKELINNRKAYQTYLKSSKTKSKNLVSNG
jgi:hypothetical protein